MLGFRLQRHLFYVLHSLLLVVVSHAWAQLSPITEGNIRINLQVVAKWLVPDDPNLPIELTPTELIQFPDGTGRFLIGTLGGQIRLHNGAGSLLETPFMTPAQTGTVVFREAGMTGLAFHPDFATPETFGFGKLYTQTTEPPDSAPADFGPGLGISTEHQDVVREWNLSVHVGNETENSFAGDISSSRELLRIDQPTPFHNVTDLAFDPDGLLYISAGDGGYHQSIPPCVDNIIGAQELGCIYGSVLRLDPNNTVDNEARGRLSKNGQYRVPNDNPFINAANAISEIWAYGFRSPYRISFDRETNDLWVGDVGSSHREEVNWVQVGGNYGWALREGTLVHSEPNAADLIDPIFEYDHDDGRAVIGGFIYRGSELLELVGKYVFAEFGHGRPRARLFYGDPATGEIFEFRSRVAMPRRILSIGEDLNGELYILAGQDTRIENSSDPTAMILRITLEAM